MAPALVVRRHDACDWPAAPSGSAARRRRHGPESAPRRPPLVGSAAASSVAALGLLLSLALPVGAAAEALANESHKAAGATKPAVEDAGEGDELAEGAAHSHVHHADDEAVASKLVAVEEATEWVTVTAAACLLGTTAAMQVLFYLTHCKYQRMRATTWKLVSSTMSIFGAVLVYNVMSTAAKMVVESNPWLKRSPYCTRVSTCLVLCQAMLYRLRNHPLKLSATATLGGHLTAFFAIGSFGKIQEVFFQSSWQCSLLAPLLFILIVTAGCSLTYLLRRTVSKLDDGRIDALEREWMSECMEYEDEVITMVLGFLFAQTLRFSLVGELVPREEDPKEQNEWAVAWMITVSLILEVGLLAATWLISGDASHHENPTFRRRASDIFKNLLGMTAAWVSLFGYRWGLLKNLTLGTASDVTANMILTLIISSTCVLVIFVLSMVAGFLDFHDRSLKAITSAVALLVGLSWETTFSKAIEGLANSDLLGHPKTVRICLSTCLFLVAYPAWQWYILPKANRRLKQYACELEPDPPSEAGSYATEDTCNETFSE